MATFWRRIKLPLGMEVGLSRDDFVLDDRDIFVHPVVWPQRTLPKIGGCATLREGS